MGGVLRVEPLWVETFIWLRTDRVLRLVRAVQPVPGVGSSAGQAAGGRGVIVNGTLVPTRDQSFAASSNNCRFSANLQVLVHADTRPVPAVGRPLPGNRRAFTESGTSDACGVAAVLADGGYRGTGCLIPHRRNPARPRTGWRADRNRDHRKVRARVEHVIDRMKNRKVLRDYRRKGDGVFRAGSAVARMHSLAMTG